MARACASELQQRQFAPRNTKHPFDGLNDVRHNQEEPHIMGMCCRREKTRETWMETTDVFLDRRIYDYNPSTTKTTCQRGKS